jgi:lysophospholipase L1-like esterase
LNLKLYNILNKIDPNNYPNIYFKSDEYMEIMKENEKAIYKFKKLSEEYNFRLLLVMFPHLENGYGFDVWIRTVPEKEYNITSLDILPIFESKANDNLESLRLPRNPNDITHPNKEGHKIAADAIYETLIREKLIPS